MSEELQTMLNKLREYLSKLYGTRLYRLILFGSQARGDAKNYSDIDVLIVLKSQVNPGE